MKQVVVGIIIFFGSDSKSVDQWWNNDIPSSLTNGTVTILSSSEASPPDDRVPQPDTCIWSPFWNSMPNSGKITGAALLFQSPPKYIYTYFLLFSFNICIFEIDFILWNKNNYPGAEVKGSIVFNMQPSYFLVFELCLGSSITRLTSKTLKKKDIHILRY